MGFYSQCFYFQIKQSLVLCKPVKRVSKRIYQSSVPEHPNYTTKLKACNGARVWPPAFTITVGCLFFPSLSTSSSLRLPRSKYLKECKGREQCAREQEGFLNSSFISYTVCGQWGVGGQRSDTVVARSKDGSRRTTCREKKLLPAAISSFQFLL